ncbi:MAG: YbaB/EbfC family nucleoid-associated protein [bacterium]|nr:YbaB/EbfC family nucleoid-associated protein [bacterium]
MFNGMDLNDLMAKAQELQKSLQEKKSAASNETVTASVGGGMVKTEMNGNLELLKVEIDPEVMDKNDKATLEDLIRAAVNENIKQVKDKGLGGPDLGDMLGNFDLSKLAGMGFPFGGEKK